MLVSCEQIIFLCSQVLLAVTSCERAQFANRITQIMSQMLGIDQWGAFTFHTSRGG